MSDKEDTYKDLITIQVNSAGDSFVSYFLANAPADVHKDLYVKYFAHALNVLRDSIVRDFSVSSVEPDKNSCTRVLLEGLIHYLNLTNPNLNFMYPAKDVAPQEVELGLFRSKKI
jgi:hypothetical protein